MNIHTEIYDENNTIHQVDSLYIATWSEWAEEEGTMLRVHHQELDEHSLGIFAYDDLYGLLGYVGVKNLSNDGKVGQIGSLIVGKWYRGRGVAPILLDTVIGCSKVWLPEMESAFAYVNEDSLPLFLSIGGLKKGMREPPYITNCKYEIDLTSALGKNHEG